MARTISIGAQGFPDIRQRGAFLVDKTEFVRDWWQSLDDVTLVCRPRRFGKTLNLSMVECFFSTRSEGRNDLFEGLKVWDDAAMRAEQGAWPVVSISFASVKGNTFEDLQARLYGRIAQAYRDHRDEVDLQHVERGEREIFTGERLAVTPEEAPDALARLCEILCRQTGRRVIVLLDEYDTPLQEAWVDGCWDDMLGLVRPLFNATLKSNPYLERALITGITRVAYNGFVRALLAGDLESMNVCMNDVAMDTFSVFDSGNQPSRTAPERFYHGFVLGLLVELRGRYQVRSNRESGYGRYDVMLVPADVGRDPGIVMEFKVRNPSREASLEDTVAAALGQIERRGYAAELLSAGVGREDIRCYGFAFEGKHVLIG